MSVTSKKDDGSKSISRALDILECFSQYNPSLSVTDLSEMLGIPFSSTARIAHALKKRGYLERSRSSKKLQLGKKIYYLGYIAKDSNLLWIASKRYLEGLCQAFRETTVIYIRNGLQRICFEQEETDQNLRYSGPIGASYELCAGSPSRIFWAFLKWEEVQEVMKDAVPTTPFSVTDEKDIREIIENIWKDGFAVSQDDYVIGYSSVSAPIFNSKLDILATITVTGPSFRFTPPMISAMCPVVRDAGIEISEIMGCNFNLLRKKFPLKFPMAHKRIIARTEDQE